MPELMEVVLAVVASIGAVLVVSGVIGLAVAAVGIVLDALSFDAQDRWEGEERE